MYFLTFMSVSRTVSVMWKLLLCFRLGKQNCFWPNSFVIYGILLHATSGTLQNLAVWWRKWNIYVETSQEQQVKPKALVFCISWGLKEKLAFRNWQDKSPCGRGTAVWTDRAQQLSFASLYSHSSSSKLKGSAEILLVAYMAVCSAPVLSRSRSLQTFKCLQTLQSFCIEAIFAPSLFSCLEKILALVFSPVLFSFSNVLRID